MLAIVFFGMKGRDREHGSLPPEPCYVHPHAGATGVSAPDQVCLFVQTLCVNKPAGTHGESARAFATRICSAFNAGGVRWP